MEHESVREVGLENAYQFLTSQCGRSTKDFLARDDYIPLWSTSMTQSEADSCIDILCDIDGIVLEQSSFAGMTMKLRYFNYLPRAKDSLVPIYAMLKKHLPLTRYSTQARKLLNESKAACIFSTQEWQTFVTVIPSEHFTSQTYDGWFWRKEFEWLMEVKTTLTQLMVELPEEDLIRDSVKKNQLRDLTKWTICPDDQEWFLKMLDRAVAATKCPDGLEVVKFSARFGERQQQPLNIDGQFDRQTIKRMSVHAAASVSAAILGLNLMWSRNGLQELIGSRGETWKCLTFAETCNYQSNLDGRACDVNSSLCRLAQNPQTMNFIQFYCDTPHLYPKTSFHPISGSVGCCGLLHHETEKKLGRDSLSYIQVMRENSQKLVYPMKCRVEIVCVTEEVPDIVIANNYMDVDHLKVLLQEYPLVIPVMENVRARSFASTIRSICNDLVFELAELYRHYRQNGTFIATWRAYQLECCLEQMFLGKVRCRKSFVFSRCMVTSALGFLKLEATGSAAVDESTLPPLAIWTNNVDNQQRIEAFFQVTNCINASLHVLGKQVVDLLLKDLLMDERFNSSRKLLWFPGFLIDLKEKQIPQWAKYYGCITSEDLVWKLIEAESRFPLVFGRLKVMLGERTTAVLLTGIKNSGINFFPAVRTSDRSKHSNLHWLGTGVWRLVQDPKQETACDGFGITQSICAELSRMNLIYPFKLAAFTKDNFEFPWISEVMKRLKGEVNDTDNMAVLLFCTCTALLMQGEYVCYKKIAEIKVPLTMKRMQQLQIFSHSQMPGLSYLNMHFLHKDIPYKLDVWKAKRTFAEKPCISKEDTTDVQVDQCAEENFEKEDLVQASVGYLKVWGSLELEILDDLMKKHNNCREWKTMFTEYVNVCLERKILVRTYNAFKAKMMRRY